MYAEKLAEGLSDYSEVPSTYQTLLAVGDACQWQRGGAGDHCLKCLPEKSKMVCDHLQG